MQTILLNCGITNNLAQIVARVLFHLELFVQNYVKLVQPT